MPVVDDSLVAFWPRNGPNSCPVHKREAVVKWCSFSINCIDQRSVLDFWGLAADGSTG